MFSEVVNVLWKGVMPTVWSVKLASDAVIMKPPEVVAAGPAVEVLASEEKAFGFVVVEVDAP